MKIESSKQIFKKYLYIIFHENQSRGIRVGYADEQMYRHAVANIRFSQFYEKRLERIAWNMQLMNNKVVSHSCVFQQQASGTC